MSDTSDSEGAASDASTPRLEITDEQRAQSEELKVKANTKFQENHFVDAIDLYSKAIDLNPRNHILFANRAFCQIKLENYGAYSSSTIFCMSSHVGGWQALPLPMRQKQ
jgi:tetratricopeptide (TPR) repeat protein